MEEMPDGDKQANKRNISVVSSNSQENAKLTKKQKLQYTPLEMNEHFSNEVYVLFFPFLNGEIRAESNFILTCKNWNAVTDYYYEKINNLKKIHQWQGDSLHNRTLNIFNGHMLTVLGLSINNQHGLINNKDRAISKQRGEHITRAPFFKYNAIPVQYVRLLLLHNKLPSIYEMPCLEDLPKFLKGDLTQELTQIANNNSLCTQNESYIYFDFIYQFYNDGYSNIKSSSLFSKINCFFGRILNEELLALKSNPHLDDLPQFAHTWKKIIELEPTPTLRMLKYAAYSVCPNDPLNGLPYFLAYKRALKSIREMTDSEKESRNYFCEQGSVALREKPGSTAEEFENLGKLCEDLEDYIEAGECYFEALKIRENSQKKPTLDDYKKLGKYMVEHEDNSLASYVYLRAFKTILSLGQIPTPEDCKNVVGLVMCPGSGVSNCGEEAILLFQQRINYIEKLGQTPTSEDYLDLNEIYVGTSSLLYKDYDQNNGQNRNEEHLNKASNNLILALKTMALSKQRPELKDYLGPFYLYGPTTKNCWFNSAKGYHVKAEHYYRKLTLSGLEIPEEVKNWGENLENYYNSVKEHFEQEWRQRFEGQLGRKRF
ncbi:MAG: hypothetical protein ACOH2E_07800 [Candidatus Paracaedibacter sp.]